jgi:hypothetical protein
MLVCFMHTVGSIGVCRVSLKGVERMDGDHTSMASLPEAFVIL